MSTSSSVKTVLEEKGTEVLSIDPEKTVLEAVHRMSEAKIGALLVVADGTPIGIFTERDVLTRVVAKGRDPDRTKIIEVMTNNLVVLSPETTIKQALAVCTEKRCRHLPIMKGNEVLGIISAGDLVRRVADLQEKEIGSLIRYITGRYPG